MWTKLLIGISVAVFHLMSVVNCTFGPYFPVGQHLQKCPSGGYSKIRCRPDLKFNDCGPGFECIRKPQLLPFDMIFCGVCCPSKRKCPVGILQGPYCSYGSKCPRGFSCQNGVCCKMKRPTCPTGSVLGQKCSLLFPCKPGNICIKGTCCSLPNKQTLPKSRPVCPKNYSPLAGVKCRVHSQCQGHAVCFYNTCCHPDKRRFPLKQPPVPPTSTVRRPPSAVPTMLPRGTVPPTKTPRKIPQTRPPVFIAPPPRPKAPPSRTRPPIMLTQAPIRPDTLSPPVRKAFCPSGLRELPGLTCDHILGCPGTSQCISGLCCAKQGDGKRRQCPADHTLIPDVNCELRQHCPLNSYCISGLCCRPKTQPTLGPSDIPSPHPCPENYTRSTDQQCTLSTCPGVDICVSGICCTKIKQHDIGMLPPICPVGYKQVTNRLCQTDVSCPLESLCIHGHCCRYVYPPTKPPATREFFIPPTQKPTQTPIRQTSQQSKTPSPISFHPTTFGKFLPQSHSHTTPHPVIPPSTALSLIPFVPSIPTHPVVQPSLPPLITESTPKPFNVSFPPYLFPSIQTTLNLFSPRILPKGTTAPPKLTNQTPQPTQPTVPPLMPTLNPYPPTNPPVNAILKPPQPTTFQPFLPSLPNPVTNSPVVKQPSKPTVPPLLPFIPNPRTDPPSVNQHPWPIVPPVVPPVYPREPPHVNQTPQSTSNFLPSPFNPKPRQTSTSLPPQPTAVPEIPTKIPKPPNMHPLVYPFPQPPVPSVKPPFNPISPTNLSFVNPLSQFTTPAQVQSFNPFPPTIPPFVDFPPQPMTPTLVPFFIPIPATKPPLVNPLPQPTIFKTISTQKAPTQQNIIPPYTVVATPKHPWIPPFTSPKPPLRTFKPFNPVNSIPPVIVSTLLPPVSQPTFPPTVPNKMPPIITNVTFPPKYPPVFQTIYPPTVPVTMPPIKVNPTPFIPHVPSQATTRGKIQTSTQGLPYVPLSMPSFPPQLTYPPFTPPASTFTTPILPYIPQTTPFSIAPTATPFSVTTFPLLPPKTLKFYPTPPPSSQTTSPTFRFNTTQPIYQPTESLLHTIPPFLPSNPVLTTSKYIPTNSPRSILVPLSPLLPISSGPSMMPGPIVTAAYTLPPKLIPKLTFGTTPSNVTTPAFIPPSYSPTPRPTTASYKITPPPILPPSSLRPYPGTFHPFNVTVPPYPLPPGFNISTSYPWLDYAITTSSPQNSTATINKTLGKIPPFKQATNIPYTNPPSTVRYTIPPVTTINQQTTVIKQSLSTPTAPSMIPTPGPKNLQPGRTTPQVPPSCPPGNISIPGLSCDHIYLCPAGSQCISGICCLSFNTVKVPACPIDFLSADPCPNPREPDQCTLDTDCGPFMICCLTSCDRRVCKPIVSPKPSRPRK